MSAATIRLQFFFIGAPGTSSFAAPRRRERVPDEVRSA
jgi:hypothetical protein